MAIGPFLLDVMTRVVNVHWGGADQGLLAEYPPGPGAPEFESINEVLNGTPTAYALESGEVFKGVNMGASGLGFTVLTPGLVCFGNPRDGDSCFIACPEYKYWDGGNDALKRGVVNDETTDLTWSAIGTGGDGKLKALCFAVDAFFAVYYNFTTRVTTIAVSFDGETWTTRPAFPSSGLLEAHGGAVAAQVKIEPQENGEDKRTITYVAAGEIEQDNSEFSNSVTNLMWGIAEESTDGVVWSFGANMGMMAEPGTSYGFLGSYACTVAAGSINGKDPIFVAAAATKTLIHDPNPVNPTPFAMLTSAPAISSDGSTWTVKAVGLAAGLDQISFGLAATYCRAGAKRGYFLMTDHEYITGEPGHAVPNSNLYKSSDGTHWDKIRTNRNWMATLSAIAKKLDATTIVRI